MGAEVAVLQVVCCDVWCLPPVSCPWQWEQMMQEVLQEEKQAISEYWYSWFVEANSICLIKCNTWTIQLNLSSAADNLLSLSATLLSNIRGSPITSASRELTGFNRSIMSCFSISHYCITTSLVPLCNMVWCSHGCVATKCRLLGERPYWPRENITGILAIPLTLVTVKSPHNQSLRPNLQQRKTVLCKWYCRLKL